MGGDAETLLTFEALLKAVKGKYIGLARNNFVFSFTSVTTDSRTVKPGSLFVPLIGEKQDGHIYIPDAIHDGASVFFITESVYESNPTRFMQYAADNLDKTFIVVENNLYALQAAARAYVEKFPRLVKIGITGSSGKTTTKEILVSILSQKYNVVSTQGNFNSETGLPLSVFNIRAQHQVGVFEMGMNRKNEIGEIADVLKPNYAIITNIGTAHIGILGSKEKIAEEKKKIFSHIKKSGAALIPVEDEFAQFLSTGIKGKVVYFGSGVPEKKSGVHFEEDCGVGGIRFAVDGIETRLAMPGMYNYENALSCIALSKMLECSAEEIVKGIEGLKIPEGRSAIENIVTKNGKHITVMNDCYNANPDSMEKSLAFCSSLELAGKKIFVLGDMKELGEQSIREHSRIGATAVLANPDMLVLVGSDMEYGVKAAKVSGCSNIKYFEDAKEENVKKIAQCILDYVQDEDFIMFKASHSMELEKVIKEICL